MSKSLEEIRSKYQNNKIPMVEYHGKLYTSDADYVQYRKEMNGKINAYNFDRKQFNKKVKKLALKLEHLEGFYSKVFVLFNVIVDVVLLYLFFTRGIVVTLFGYYDKIAYSSVSTVIIDVPCVIAVVYAVAYLLAKVFALCDAKIITDHCGYYDEGFEQHVGQFFLIEQYCDILLVTITEYNNLVITKNKEIERDRIERERKERERKEHEERERLKKEQIERERAAEEERRRQEYERSLAGQYEAMKRFMATNPEYVRQRQQQELEQMEREAQERIENARRMEYEAEEREQERQQQRENENRYENTGYNNGRKIFSAVQRGNEVYVYGEHGLLYFKTGCRLINWTSDSVIIYSPNVSGPNYDIYDAYGACIGHTPRR